MATKYIAKNITNDIRKIRRRTGNLEFIEPGKSTIISKSELPNPNPLVFQVSVYDPDFVGVESKSKKSKKSRKSKTKHKEDTQ